MLFSSSSHTLQHQSQFKNLLPLFLCCLSACLSVHRIAPTPSPTPALYGCRYYSAHDTTCGLFLAAFQRLADWPPFATHIVVELHQDAGGELYVRFLYNDVVQYLPGCEQNELCPYATFAALASRVVMTAADWSTECQSTGPVQAQGWVSMYLC